MREDTKAKCEAIRAFGLVYIREQLAAGGDCKRQLTYHRLCKAYADSLGVGVHWCVANLHAIAGLSSLCDQREALCQLWESDPPLASGSLRSYFKNGPFSMQKLLYYARRASCGGAAEASAPESALPAAPSGRRPRKATSTASAESAAAVPSGVRAITSCSGRCPIGCRSALAVLCILVCVLACFAVHCRCFD